MESIGLFKLAELHNSWLAARQVTVASNVANVDTPGYRSIDVKPFASVMSEIGDEAAARERLTGANGSLLGASDIRQLNPDWGTKLSGNTVSVEQELLRGQEIRASYSLNLSVTRAFHNMLLAATRG